MKVLVKVIIYIIKLIFLFQILYNFFAKITRNRYTYSIRFPIEMQMDFWYAKSGTLFQKWFME